MCAAICEFEMYICDIQIYIAAFCKYLPQIKYIGFR